MGSASVVVSRLCLWAISVWKASLSRFKPPFLFRIKVPRLSPPSILERRTETADVGPPQAVALTEQYWPSLGVAYFPKRDAQEETSMMESLAREFDAATAKHSRAFRRLCLEIPRIEDPLLFLRTPPFRPISLPIRLPPAANSKSSRLLTPERLQRLSVHNCVCICRWKAYVLMHC